VNDDVQSSPFHSKVGWVANGGTDYFILVHGFGATDVGTFTLNITCDPTPVNDNCSSATLITGAVGSLGGTWWARRARQRPDLDRRGHLRPGLHAL
jgi:hypothetical protein